MSDDEKDDRMGIYCTEEELKEEGEQGVAEKFGLDAEDVKEFRTDWPFEKEPTKE